MIPYKLTSKAIHQTGLVFIKSVLRDGITRDYYKTSEGTLVIMKKMKKVNRRWELVIIGSELR